MSSPSVSVVMSVYNEERFVGAAIDSIRQQTFTNFEFIIIDDGSTDGTAGVLARHASEDARIKILSQENCGLIASLNRGLATASSGLIARMDGDDVSAPTRLEQQWRVLQQAPNVVVVGSAIDRIDNDGRVVSRWLAPAEPSEIRAGLMRQNCMAHPTVMMRRNACLSVGGYRSAFLYCEDYDLWLRLAEIGDLMNLSEPLVNYRISRNNFAAEYVEQERLSVLGAQASAARRRVGQPDPANDASLITRDVLEALGLRRSWVDFKIMNIAIRQARRAAKAGEREAAQRLLALANRQQIDAHLKPYRWLLSATI